MLTIVKKNFNIFLVSIVISCFFISFGAATENQDRYGGTLNVGETDEPPTLDWIWTSASTTRKACMFIWEHLLEYDERDVVNPMLAKDWEISEDDLTWTFHLREGILFHNGKEMTAEDAAASARRWVDISISRGLLKDVESIKVVDKYTFEITSNTKLGSLPNLIAMSSGGLVIMPKEICDSPGGQLTEYIGTGPYMFEDWKLDQSITLTRFPDYKSIDLEPSNFAGKKYAYFDTIILNYVPELSTLLGGLETGIFDIVSPVDIMEVQRLKGVEGIEVMKYPHRSLKPEFNSGHGLFTDVRLKHAVIKACDYDEIMHFVGKTEEGYEMLPGQFHPDSIWYTKIREDFYNESRSQDIEGAKKLMEEAGYDGEELVILCSTQYPYSIDSAIAMFDQLKEVGFNVRLEIYDWATITSVRQGTDWGLLCSGGDLAPDPLTITRAFMGGNYNRYESPELQEQGLLLIQEDTYEKRYQAWENIERIIVEDPPLFTPGLKYLFRAFKSDIKDVPITSLPIFWNVYRE